MAWNSGLQIRVLDGSDRGKVFLLDTQEMTLGRALDPKEEAPGWILFSEPTVSRIHAILQWKEAQRGYLLQHRSRTNPTLVDGKSVDQHLLQPGQKVQLGLLVFGVEAVEIRTGRLGDAVQASPQGPPVLKKPVLEALNDLAEEKSREPMEGLAGLADEAPARGRRQARSTPGGLQLVAAQGPDQGSRFSLRETLLVLGRRLGPDDPRQSAGVLLNDDSLPSEQALLVWHDREYTYGILQSEGSPVPTRLRRVLSGRPKEIVIGSDLPTPLYDGDVIMVGQSSLVVRKVAPSPEEDEEEKKEDQTRSRGSSRPSWPESREQRRGLGALESGASPKSSGSRSSLRTWREKADSNSPDSPQSTSDSPRPGSIEDSQDPGPLRPRRMPGAPAEATSSKPIKPQSHPRSIRTGPTSPPAAPRKESPASPPPSPEPPLETPVPLEPPVTPPRRRPRPAKPVVDSPEEPLAMPPPPPRAPVQEPEEPLAMPAPPPRAPVQEPEEPLAMPAPPPRAPVQEPEEPLAMPPPVQPEAPPPPPGPTEPGEPPEPESQIPFSQPVASVETPEETPAVGGIVPRGLPPHLERSLRGGRTVPEPSSPPAPAGEMPDVPLFDPESFGSSTSAWRHHSDFVVGYLEGSRKGQKVDLLSSEFSEDRVVTIGSPGQRFNDIEVDEAEMSNDQAVMRYRSGRFTLVNFRSEIQVNSLALGEGDEVVLMTGDRIHLGNTVLIFLERRVVEALRNLHLEILEGVQADLGKSFDLNKERLMIGRGRNCDIRLADPEISRVHCVLVLRNNRFFVQHRSETNPTFVNGISLLPGAERQVVVGDRIQVSSQTVLQFRTRS